MRGLIVFVLIVCAGCVQPPRQNQIHVAAAANLARVFPDLARACLEKTGIELIPSYGATGQLSQQIENGGPFQLFLAADLEHVDALSGKGLIVPGSRAVYARGKLVIWAPRKPELARIQDLAGPGIRQIGIARPELAPYGRATIEALTASGMWPALEKKVAYGQSISAVKQFADSSNVDAAFTALSLVKDSAGHYIEIDEKLYQPIDQAMCIVKSAGHAAEAKKAEDFLMGAAGQAIFERAGYLPFSKQ